MKKKAYSRPVPPSAPYPAQAAAPGDAWLRLAESGLLAVLMAVPTLMSVAMDRGYEIPKLAALIPLAALALGGLLAFGLRDVLLPLWRDRRWQCVALGAFALSVLLASAISDSGALALYGTFARREGLATWLAYLAIFVIAATTLCHPGGVGRFVDALLLSSIIPAAYALQQRVGLDFFLTVMADPGRSAGTLGNPNFLAGYLALIVPLTLVRAWLARGAVVEALLWLWLAAWQFLALLQTQSRGPLLALLAALALLACLAAARAGARKWLAVGAVCGLLLLLFLALLNLHPAVASWARDLPVLNRLIFVSTADASAATALAARSVVARLGIWQAAADTWAAAPLVVKVFGFGPDAAHVHFLAHVPPQLMSSEGYQQVNTFDRTHADMLEITVSFGAFGLAAWIGFHGAVMFVAARALLGLQGPAQAWLFAGLAFWCGVLGAVAAAGVGLRPAVPAAFGLGLALGWVVFVAVGAVSGLRRGTAARLTGDWVLLAGLTMALLVCWIDAQINIPVIATRVVAFALAAAVLVQSGRVGRVVEAPAACPLSGPVTGWLAGIGAVCALASFLAISLEQVVRGPDLMLWPLKLPAILMFACFAAAVAWFECRRTGMSHGAAARSFAAWLFVPVAIFSLGESLLGRVIDAAPDGSLPESVAGLTVWPVAVMAVFCILRAWPGASGLPRGGARSMSGPFLAAGAMALVSISVLFCWRQAVGDIAFNLAGWARQARHPDVRATFLAHAVRTMPHERHYLRRLIFDALERAALRLQGSGGVIPFEAVKKDLSEAELHARAALARYPHDPWLVVALANVRQHQALAAMRPFDPAGGADAATESRALFRRAMLLYPAQPLVYLGWAQLEFDQGGIAAAYVLLDRMESLIPDSPDPYRERMLMARAAGDRAAMEAALLRAAKRVDGAGMALLKDVAATQQ